MKFDSIKMYFKKKKNKVTNLWADKLLVETMHFKDGSLHCRSNKVHEHNHSLSSG